MTATFVSEPTVGLPDPFTPEQWRCWREEGYILLKGFADPSVGQAMLDKVVDLCRRAAAGEKVPGSLVLPEIKVNDKASKPEDLISKVFKLHRIEEFRSFANDDRVLDAVSALLGAERIDVFLSQFIFKNPGAMGQPWHQDSYYFPFEPDHQVGVWLAVTEATLENGCLWVLPRSHTEPVHEHVPDRRPDAQYGYVEIVDHDMEGAFPLLLDPGDVLLFDSHLMHRSTDNVSDGIRAAMVFHYSQHGTVDRNPASLVVDWVNAR